MARIAVIDDDVELLATIGSMLSEAQHKVLLFDKPADALAALPGAQADLVIMDVFMPAMDGFRFLEALRPKLPSVPVIAISGGGKFLGGSVLGELAEYGVTGTLAKPFRRDQLLALIRQILSR